VASNNLRPTIATAASPSFSRLSDLLRDTDVLCFGEEPQRFFAAFAADAALFHAAERDAQIAHQPAIHPDGAGADSLGDAMGAAQVLRPDARRQAVFHIIGVIDHFFFAVEGRDCYDGAENFFAICAA
jgi:hypothetical protein